MAATYIGALTADPTGWLLDPSDPAVRAETLVRLLGRAGDDPEVVAARGAAMTAGPIVTILGAQDAEGWWEKPGGGYGKYRGTAWSLIFLDQLGADGLHPAIRRACEYVMTHTQTAAGGFGILGGTAVKPPPPAAVVHCLNGNLLAALIGFGLFEDPRVQRAIEWETAAILGEPAHRYYASGTTGPTFACAANGALPCAWGGVKALRALTRIPADRRTEPVQRAIETAAEFLLSRDPAVADYPAWEGRISSSWFKLGFPSGYVADVLQNIEALAAAGYAADSRLARATEWLLSKRDAAGRWKNEFAYHGKMWVDIDRQGQPSKWVTLRACALLQARLG